MRISIQEVALLVIIFLINMIVPVLLQIFLSTRKNKWYGRVIPSITFLISVVILLQGNLWMHIGLAFLVFLLVNIPTAIFLGIYIAGQKHVAKKTELEKMKFQDLN